MEECLVNLMHSDENPSAASTSHAAAKPPPTTMSHQKKKSLWSRFDPKIEKNSPGTDNLPLNEGSQNEISLQRRFCFTICSFNE
ncbi:hypothetical protein E2C01_031346 [Portunus trituberculatus]|uniref:Uncharacterized protein n=1 Tax=Portunus trituberculatus TaxID=210409 RepID=A0A5B7ET69_PORTR|nr:hypothetical protein [Portunus trituberculatus]